MLSHLPRWKRRESGWQGVDYQDPRAPGLQVDAAEHLPLRPFCAHGHEVEVETLPACAVGRPGRAARGGDGRSDHDVPWPLLGQQRDVAGIRFHRDSGPAVEVEGHRHRTAAGVAGTDVDVPAAIDVVQGPPENHILGVPAERLEGGSDHPVIVEGRPPESGGPAASDQRRRSR